MNKEAHELAKRVLDEASSKRREQALKSLRERRVNKEHAWNALRSANGGVIYVARNFERALVPDEAWERAS